MTLAEKYGPPLLPANPRVTRITTIPDARQRRILTAHAIYPDKPLDELCRPPLSHEDRKAILKIMQEGGAMFCREWLTHLFDLPYTVDLHYRPKGRPKRYKTNY